MTKTPKRVALYARVSMLNGQHPEMQIEELREFCRRRGWKVMGEYIDRMSGKRDSRPELDRLYADCRRRAVDAVVVYRYDRFARSLRHLVNALDEFRSLGIDFVSLHEGVDTSTPNGRLVFGIFASIAEFERELISERVRSGLAHARAKGKKLGRPGYPVNGAEVLALRSSGASIRAIAAQLNSSIGTISRTIAGGSYVQAEN